MTARDTFGPTLRQQRERRGVTLESIAEATKVSRSLFAALERNDVSRWPGGIYRRCFFREYAAAIGLPPESTLLEFLRLFPEPGQELNAFVGDDDERRLRLTLVPESAWKTHGLRVLAALLDVGAVLSMGYSLFLVSGASVWMLISATGLGYHAVNTALLGQSLGSWCLAGVSRVPRTSRSSWKTVQIATAALRFMAGTKAPAPQMR